MSRTLSAQLLSEFYGQTSSTPFLTLVTLSHTSFSTIYLVDNTEDIVSNGNTFIAFPMRVTLPVDDGETTRAVKLTFDNTGLELIDELRTVTDPIDVTIEMILSNDPDTIQIAIDELKLKKITYTSSTISGSLLLDDFLNTEMGDERYTPTTYPGLF